MLADYDKYTCKLYCMTNWKIFCIINTCNIGLNKDKKNRKKKKEIEKWATA